MAEDDEEATAQLFEQFWENCETLNGLIFQTRNEWLGEKSSKSIHGKWKNKSNEIFDDYIGMNVPHWKEIPYINETIEINLAEDIAFANELKDRLSEKFEAKQFDANFAASWGLFCLLIGGFESLLNAKHENRSTARGITSGHVQDDIKAQKLWFSLLYLELQKCPAHKNRNDVEDAIVETIHYCIKADIGKEEGFGKNWFRKLLGDPKVKMGHHLSSAFQDKKFSIAAIKKTARNRAYEIPTLKGLQRLIYLDESPPPTG